MTVLKDGNIPYIGATNRNNGIIRFVAADDNFQQKDKCIAFISQGDGAAGYSVYRETMGVYAGTVICAYKKELNRKNGLFISSSSDMSENKYSHGYSRNSYRLKRDIIMLPVTSDGKIDYGFMESFVKKIESQKIHAYKEYAKKRLVETQLPASTKIEKLEDKEWREFEIKSLFSRFVQGKSKGLNHLSEENGYTPYLGATNRNNGVLTFIREEKKLEQNGNCICFIRNGQGSVGYSVYKAESFVYTSDNTFAYAEWLNKFNGHFIVTASDMIRSKYSFGYKRNNERLLKDKLMLPTDSSGSPDYAYMERYIKSLMHEKYADYLDFKKGE